MTSPVLASIRTRRTLLERDVAVLLEVERLFRETDQLIGVEPIASAPPVADGASPTLSPSAGEILRYIEKHGPVRIAPIHAALGGSRSALNGKLMRLVAAGTVERRGKRPKTTYRVPGGPAQRAGTMSPCNGPEDLLALIAAQAPVSSERLYELTGQTYPKLFGWGHELACRSLVTFEGEGRACVWSLAPAEDLPARVAATVSAHPGALDERKVAQTLNASLDRVGLAFAELVDRGMVALTEGGTYVPVA